MSTSDRPLTGRVVVVTRAEAQAGPLVERLRAGGARVVEIPLIQVLDPVDGRAELDAALGDLDRVEWLVVTSPNGAARVRAALAGRPPGRPRVAAVGTATAAALGRPVDVLPEVQTAEGLLAAMPPEPARALVVQAEAARPALVDGLRAAGWDVRAIVGYRTVPITLRDRPAGLEGADAVTFTSGSTVRAWVAAFGRWAPPCVVVIGPSTAAVADEQGLKVSAIATDHSLAGLADAVELALRRSP